VENGGISIIKSGGAPWGAAAFYGKTI